MTKYILRGAGTAVLLLAVILGCQSTQPVAPVASAIQVETSGFSPFDMSGQNTIEISLLMGNSDALKSWKVEVAHTGTVLKTFTGDASVIPAALQWDGKGDSGLMSPDGAYTAKLSIDYGMKFPAATAETRSFVLDVASPIGAIALDPAKFTPNAKGVVKPITLTINARSTTAHMESWALDVFDDSGMLVNSWSGLWPNASVSWDGSSMNGGFVVPDSGYSAVAYVRDEYGNMGRLTADVAVAALPQVTPVAPILRDPGIVALQTGFSPNDDHVADTLTLDISYGKQTTPMTTWEVTIVGSSPEFGKTWTGTAAGMPGRLQWDGKTDRGNLAPEGTYTATLSVRTEGTGTIHTAKSAPFVLDITPPTGTVTLSSPLYSPFESSDTITLRLDASSKTAKIDSWTMDIREPGGRLFRSFSAKWPSATAVWNGKSMSGEMVESAEDYTVLARVRDQYGVTGNVRVIVPVDILMEKTTTGYRILASRIFFQAFTADYTHVGPALAEQNVMRLNNLATKLAKYPGYKIRIVGHAVMVNWDRPQAGRDEQKNVLIPLSMARASAVEAALVDRGLEKKRFTMEGVGASDQLVPDSNYTDRWRNRRVALFLDQ
jgi:flagellar hook assembly protein FlgD